MQCLANVHKYEATYYRATTILKLSRFVEFSIQIKCSLTGLSALVNYFI